MTMDTETKREKFVRIAEARTNKTLDMIKLLGNCSNSSVYEYTDKDVAKIFDAIESELREVKKRFSSKDAKESGRFRLE